ncbi:helix-turn-helix transcriptional regulator [Sphingobium estronivorans]|uniref:helix-turn-helix transcriptional regulator n=1 Tax=Sphingobium estronivorans TaxID=1577690 RepID=UPI0013C3347A|nr:helix-turn-helix transcriptional regulator [Sphingobium estronivorans]
MIDLRDTPDCVTRPWTVLAAMDSAAAWIELRRYDLPRPNEMWELDDAPILSITMPRAEGTEGEIMFDSGERRRHRVGRLMLRPAGIAMHSRGDGGVLDILRCRFDPVLFAEVTGISDWDSRLLGQCAALSSAPIMSLAEKLRHEMVTRDFGSDMAVEALVRLLLVEIGRMFRSPLLRSRGQASLAPWQIARVEDVLRNSDGAWPTTEELAELCGISRSHLSRSFAATTGRSLADHAAAIRLERAQDMIRLDKLPMGQIAETLGFATASAFSAAFRRATGYTPSQFRQSLR